MKLSSQSPTPYEGLSRTHLELFDGEDFMVTHTATPEAARAIEDGHATDVQQIAFANGSFTGRTVLGPLVDGIIKLAGCAGRKIEITTYDDPLTGSRAYRQSYRTERFAHVLQHVRQRHQLDTDYPVSLAGQSRGWLTVSDVAYDTYKDQNIGSLTGMAPIGHTPMDIEVNPRDVMHVLGMTWGEITDKRAQQQDYHAYVVKLAIARNAVAHTLGNGFSSFTLNPWTVLRRSTLPFFHEAQEILTTDITEKVVTLSQNIGRLTLAACRYDRYAPGEQVVERFAGEPSFEGRIGLLDTPHNGPLLDSKLVPVLYEYITGDPARQFEEIPTNESFLS